MIFVFILIAYGVALSRMSVPLTGDQKVYISVALEMKERASYLIPYLFDRPNFLKPPFQYWMTLLGWKVFGVSIIGAIIPSVLALVAAAYLVRRLSVTRSNLSALVFSSTLATMTYGTTAQMEIWIVLFYLGAWIFYLEKKLVLTFLAVGVMAWVKGPLYPALFVLSLIFKAFLDKNPKEVLKPKFIAALALGVGVGLAWYVAAAYYEYEPLMNQFLGRENFGKIQTSQGSPIGLWSEFLGTLFPVIFLIIASIADPTFRERFQKHKTFWLAFALIPALFFTFFPYRVNTYLYLLTPLAAWFVLENPKPSRRVRLMISGAVSVMTLFALVFLYRLAGGAWLSPVLASAFALTFIVWAISHFKMNALFIAGSSLILVNLVRIGATELGEWDLVPLRASATQTQKFAYVIGPSEEDIWHEFGLVSSALGYSVARVHNEDEERAFLQSGGTLILTDSQTTLANTHCEPWRRLKKRMKFPVRDLLQNGLSIEDPALHRNYQLCRS